MTEATDGIRHDRPIEMCVAGEEKKEADGNGKNDMKDNKMSNAEKYFLKYIQYDTQSSPTTGTHPSTSGQAVLAKVLAEDLNELGVQDVTVSEHAYVMGFLPATPGLEPAPALGLIAHMDTVDCASGKDIKPSIVTYQGGCIPLGDGSRVTDPAVFPSLKKMIGHRLVVTDGTTLLGADNKAGVAAIVAALEEIQNKGLQHGKICICFTPDEEIGEGAMFFDVHKFGADFAFTVDGGDPREIEYQNFNAAQATVEITGVSVHPGSAKNIMVNAAKTAMEFDALLPQNETPETTEKFEGFYHLIHLEAEVGKARMIYLLRDHDAVLFEQKKAKMREAAGILNKKYNADTVKVTIKDQYRNMKEIVQNYPELLEIAADAVRNAGYEPVMPPIRGGTDGARLSFMGLPCPNIGTGARHVHGEHEYLSLDENEKVVQIIHDIIKSFSKRKKDLSFM